MPERIEPLASCVRTPPERPWRGVGSLSRIGGSAPNGLGAVSARSPLNAARGDAIVRFGPIRPPMSPVATLSVRERRTTPGRMCGRGRRGNTRAWIDSSGGAPPRPNPRRGAETPLSVARYLIDQEPDATRGVAAPRPARWGRGTATRHAMGARHRGRRVGGDTALRNCPKVAIQPSRYQFATFSNLTGAHCLFDTPFSATEEGSCLRGRPRYSRRRSWNWRG